jgi:hypothetical protein
MVRAEVESESRCAAVIWDCGVQEAAIALGIFAPATGRKRKRRTRPAMVNLNGIVAAFP